MLAACPLIPHSALWSFVIPEFRLFLEVVFIEDLESLHFVLTSFSVLRAYEDLLRWGLSADWAYCIALLSQHDCLPPVLPRLAGIIGLSTTMADKLYLLGEAPPGFHS